MQSAHALAMNELNKIRENNITELEEKKLKYALLLLNIQKLNPTL